MSEGTTSDEESTEDVLRLPTLINNNNIPSGGASTSNPHFPQLLVPSINHWMSSYSWLAVAATAASTPAPTSELTSHLSPQMTSGFCGGGSCQTLPSAHMMGERRGGQTRAEGLTVTSAGDAFSSQPRYGEYGENGDVPLSSQPYSPFVVQFEGGDGSYQSPTAQSVYAACPISQTHTTEATGTDTGLSLQLHW